MEPGKVIAEIPADWKQERSQDNAVQDRTPGKGLDPEAT